MKKFLYQLIVCLAIVFFITATSTLFIEFKNKGALGGNSSIEIRIEDNKIIPPIESDLAKANYTFSKNFFILKLIMNILVPIFIIKTSILTKVEEVYSKATRSNFRRGIAIGSAYTIISFILMFPITFFSSFYRLRLVGLLNYNFSTWSFELIKGELIEIMLFSLLVGVVFSVIRSKKNWGAILAGIYILGNLFSAIVYPVAIDPLINDIKPLSNKVLEEKILTLAKDHGVENLKVYEVKKSHETSALNAYMTGILSSKRIVIWDTTLNSLKEEEILAVVAHEIGHYTLNHIPKSMALDITLTIINYAVAVLLLLTFNRRRGRSLKSAYGLIYVILYSTIINMVLSPISLYYSRKMEVEADRFAIEATGDNITNGVLELRLMESNLSPYDVARWYKVLRLDHPTVKERVELSNEYSN